MSTDRWADVLACGDVDALAITLHRDVVLVSDGGGRVVTPLRPVRGAASVARVVSTAVGGAHGRTLTVEQANGRRAVVVRRSGRACAVIITDVDGALVTRVWLVLNPDKLGRWHAPR